MNKLCCLLALVIGGVSPLFGVVQPLSGSRTGLPDSVLIDPGSDSPSGARILRRTLTAEENAQSLDLVVSLRMRNFEKLEAILQSGGTVSKAEMEAEYLPLRSDFDKLAAWLQAQGFSRTLEDGNRTNLFVRGTVAAASAAFQVPFARVATSDGEFSSAVGTPSLPAAFGSTVLGIAGLQPQLQMRTASGGGGPVADASAHPTRAIPSDLLAAYHVPSSLNGSGQTIGIFATALPLSTDLAAFDGATGTPAGTFTVVPVNGGPLPGGGSLNEVSLDLELASGIAPGANFRIYAAPDGTITSFMAACTTLLNEGLTNLFTSSISQNEAFLPAASMQSSSQLLAQMAAAGITVFHGAGDSGSYGSGAGVEYPTSDPYVTATGGTVMTWDANWSETGETAWSNTGGGYSGFFSRPAWQVGTGVPSGTMRCIPDIAAPASVISPTTGAIFYLIVVNGSTVGIGGDSATGPVWAGLTAILNQARANAKLPSVGLLGPQIYPLIGTSAFTDITSGNNGGYSAGVGYDLCTGIGTPYMPDLIYALTHEPAVSAPSPSSVSPGGAVSMSAAVSGNATYQWQLNGANIPGATGSTYAVAHAGAADRGSYSVAVTTYLGTAVYPVGSLSVSASDARLLNLSVRAYTAPGANALVVGVSIAGSGSKSILLRGIGPTLASYGVPGALAAPVLTLFDAHSATLGSNSGWGGDPKLKAAMATVGAFTLPDNSADAALLPMLTPGTYTAQVSGANGTSGIALAEAYDLEVSGSPAARLANISGRAYVQPGASNATAGFVIGAGPTGAPETVLIRGVGPALSDYGVPGILAAPVVTLFDQPGNVIARNQGWSTAPSAGASSVAAGVEPASSAVMSQIGAFGLAAGSGDSAIVATLPPGLYTVQLSDANGQPGVGLIEVYEVR